MLSTFGTVYFIGMKGGRSNHFSLSFKKKEFLIHLLLFFIGSYVKGLVNHFYRFHERTSLEGGV